MLTINNTIHVPKTKEAVRIPASKSMRIVANIPIERLEIIVIMKLAKIVRTIAYP